MHEGQFCLCEGIALFCGLALPFKCLLKIAGHTLAGYIHITEHQLPAGISLFSCLAIPVFRQPVIDGGSVANSVHVGEFILCACMPLICGFYIPANGLWHVFRHTIAIAPQDVV